MSHPFLDLATEALNQLHPRFAGKGALAYPPGDADGPAAARKERERPFVREFYHQFRRLWDKALPVRLGLGHVVIQPDPAPPPGRQPDLLVWQLGEHGAADRPLAALCFVSGTNTDALAVDLTALTRYRTAGYAVAVLVVVGTTEAVAPEGVTILRFDPDRWLAVP
ncbi:hypothetical protein [Urbifossiella limnaea]|uniref:Uncharacterized protein n=1 Tax=Urbifossiella limnaea TaxID=2528023 RepID=A0A517XYA7_9BACT|nr:hypothetical protein [Urbifossiella limnaea]QDU22494.1 hypothetical protein ETAA1_44750 [Urbifossiella limnaea]